MLNEKYNTLIKEIKGDIINGKTLPACGLKT